MTKAVFTSYEAFKEKFDLPFTACVTGAYTDPASIKVLYIENVAAVFLRDEEIRGKTHFDAQGFGWKAKRNAHFHFYYSTAEARAEKVLTYLSSLAKHKAEVAKNRKGSTHDVKVGDVFSASWGYDQTNVDYYKVTRTTKCTADLVKIGCKRVDDSHVSPNPDHELEETFKRKRIQAGYKGEPSIRIDSVCYASRTTLDSVDYTTPWGMGH